MPRLLALEWNDAEARVAVASSAAGGLRVEQAFSVSLSPRPGAEAAVDVGDRIATAMAARGLGRLDTLVAVGRASIELRQLSVPEVPEDELPDVVRFQALREFNALEEDWPLDFLPLEDGSEGARSVLAAAIDPDLVSSIQGTCQTAGLKPRRLVLRACAAASLLRRKHALQDAHVRLLVDLLGGEADLTVMVRGQVIFLRTARLPGDPLAGGEAGRALEAEIRRTMAAVQNRLRGERVESIVLCGTGETHQQLAESIQGRLSTPAELFDPFAGLALGPELTRGLPDHPERFAPLLGVLSDELGGVAPAVDFLHPRRRAEPPGRRRTLVAAGLAVVAAVLLVASYFWLQSHWLRQDIDRLTRESQALDKEVAKAEELGDAVEALDRWADQETVWLDELRWLSENFPTAKEAMLTHLTLNPHADGGKMEMNGLARDVETVKALESGLRIGRHDVMGEGKGEAEGRKFYSLRFDSTVVVRREESP